MSIEKANFLLGFLHTLGLFCWGIGVYFVTKYEPTSTNYALLVVVLMFIIFLITAQNCELENLKEKDDWNKY